MVNAFVEEGDEAGDAPPEGERPGEGTGGNEQDKQGNGEADTAGAIDTAIEPIQGVMVGEGDGGGVDLLFGPLFEGAAEETIETEGAFFAGEVMTDAPSAEYDDNKIG